MKKQKVYIEVSVEDELPQVDKIVTDNCKFSSDVFAVEGYKRFSCYYNHNTNIWQREDNGKIVTPTHWLKPVKRVYVITEDELVTIKNRSFNEGYGDGRLPF